MLNVHVTSNVFIMKNNVRKISVLLLFIKTSNVKRVMNWLFKFYYIVV